MKNKTSSRSYIFTARKRSLGQGNVFTPVCHSINRGVGFPACITGHMTSGGSASREWVCIQRVGRPPPQHYGIRSTSGRYASYWNAFLFQRSFVINRKILAEYNYAFGLKFKEVIVRCVALQPFSLSQTYLGLEKIGNSQTTS